MAINFNGVEISNVNIDGVAMGKVYIDGNLVYTATTHVITAGTGDSGGTGNTRYGFLRSDLYPDIGELQPRLVEPDAPTGTDIISLDTIDTIADTAISWLEWYNIGGFVQVTSANGDLDLGVAEIVTNGANSRAVFLNTSTEFQAWCEANLNTPTDIVITLT